MKNTCNVTKSELGDINFIRLERIVRVKVAKYAKFQFKTRSKFQAREITLVNMAYLECVEVFSK